MFKINIDGKNYDVNPSSNLLQACLTLGFNIPYFCWHPKLGSIGACRQCAVKKYQNKKDTSGRIVMSCMTPVEENSIITINDIESQNFRKNIIELLMLNHPHDCPVCEEGGNCHLQDMTVMTQHVHRRYRFNKKKYKSQYLGFFISHEMNRCISCYRCVRYYKDYADGKDFDVYGINQNLFFGRFQNGELESEYSGNLIDVCPTGVFTDKTYSENYTRKWDLQNAPSICSHCSIGCNIIAGERSNEIRRIENRYHEDINNYFLCDLGRFSYGYSNFKDRLKYCYIKNKNIHQKVDLNTAIQKVVKIFRNSSNVIGIGSSRASIETNFMLKKLVGEKNFSTGMLDIDHKCTNLILKILKKNTIKIPSLKEVENYDVIFVLGEDITQTSSRLGLSIRQALKKISSEKLKFNNIQDWHSVANKNVSHLANNFLFITNTYQTKLNDISNFSYEANPQEQAYFAFCISENLKNNFSYSNTLPDYLKEKSIYITNILLQAKNALIISGSHSRNLDLIKSSYNIARNLKKLGLKVGLMFLTPCSNSMGVNIINGCSLNDALKKAQKKNCTLIITENDLFNSLSKSILKKKLKNIKNIIVIDHQKTKVFNYSHVFLPASNFFESSGTLINYELRAQRFFQVYDVNFYNHKINILPSWKFLNLINKKIDLKNHSFDYLDNIIDLCAREISFLKNIKESAPNSLFKVFGQKIPRSSNRSSGRTSLRADINIHEISQTKDNETMFSFSMEGSSIYKKYTSFIPFVWSPQWNSSQGVHKFQKEVSGSLLAGNTGKFLLSSKLNHKNINFSKIPKKFIKTNNLIVVPYYLLFGSEEISQYSPVVQKKMVSPYLIINKIDAQRLKILNKNKVSFTYLSDTYTFFAIFSNNLALGHIALPIGQFSTPISLIGKEIQDLKEV
ncbi:NADH-quinone oxidoreductase subunit NuoG [Buchnera aphidicola]|uniref:NADH-quinone oxidoreductase subunit NuoG n=1 Tax=Buchnera aphidicola TaxID=9 RepID=UPI0022388940|nr:NADH-quinone oxidoreductase subunit NuoG [Buchnera aphidicola]MCW5197653.1 NADH-quinone oxidoreductase subunit NuoG [Buchnera aphidicola (Chaitophorus viminalis)]